MAIFRCAIAARKYLNMKEPIRKSQRPTRKRLVYPKQSNGTKWAAENRKKASALSDAERAALFKSGILRLYGGIAGQAVRSGR